MTDLFLSTALGSLAFFLVMVNTVVHFILIFPPSCLKILLSGTRLEAPCSRVVIRLAFSWVGVNNLIFSVINCVEWDIEVPDGLREDQWYLVVSNHQCWADVLVLQKALAGKAPFLKFFLKDTMIWMPLMGFVWWAMDMPFLKRHSSAYLKRHPEMRGRDLEKTRRSCEKFKNLPTSVIVFAEGTRYTRAKSLKQRSPYRHLLKPKAGGVGLALTTMGEYLSAVLDVTIVYSKPTFWFFLSSRRQRIVVRLNLVSIPEDLLKNVAGHRAESQQKVRDWINQLWEQKDERIESVHAEGLLR